SGDRPGTRSAAARVRRLAAAGAGEGRRGVGRAHDVVAAAGQGRGVRLPGADGVDPAAGRWLLTEIVPAHVVQTREQAMRMVPALRWFVSFLRARGHWHPDSMSPGEAPTVIAELEFPVLEAADDPS